MGLSFLLALGICISAHAAPSLPAPLQEAKDSIVDLDSWRFHADPSGHAKEWSTLDVNDASWPLLNAEQTWQEQGYPQVHGTAWYRVHVPVPAAWRGSKVFFRSEGVAQEYDIYVNGKFVRHFGSPELPVNAVPTQVRLDGFLAYGQSNVIALRVNDHGGGGGVRARTQLRRVIDLQKFRSLLPEPIAEAHPDLVDLYWNSWRMAWEKVSFGNSHNHFVPAYMEEGYDGLIYQWDSIFISMYGRYGRRLFPAMAALDNFYSRQEPSGYIQRIYSKTTGLKVLEPDPAAGYAVTNPPLFAWAEWDYYQITGDASRLARVLPILEKYDHWIETNQRSKSVPGMYWQTGFDSGMDNMPRPNADGAGWVDMSLQEVLAAKYLALISSRLGDKTRAEKWTQVFHQRREIVNQLAWSEKDGIYYDVDQARNFTQVKHIGAFWALLADAANEIQAAQLVKHLQDPKEFFRPHLFPALSASDPGYSPTASYWRGGVWASTNYMVNRGLMHTGFTSFARQAALNHLQSMATVYASKVDEKRIDPNETDESYHTIWECYNPEQLIPCTRADAFYFGRQNFAGWTALGPVSLLIEQVIGLEILGAENRIVWRLQESGKIGLNNFELGRDNLVSLVADAASGGERYLHVNSRKPFALQVQVDDVKYDFAVPAGETKFRIGL